MKVTTNSTTNPHEIIDFALKGNVIRFYLGKNGDQWGDDWDDAPYEHNAGQVYDEYVLSIFDCYVPFDCLVLEPCNGCSNSPFCKEDMIKGKVPCIIIVPAKIAKESWNDYSFDYWLGNKDVIKVYFGDDISQVQIKIDDLYTDTERS